ncbi:MAG: DUF1292 domain-containing protein [Lachnoclostridium sp.]|nr:DUF1292 domain-containing protein [Lachnoclostridium sp.]
MKKLFEIDELEQQVFADETNQVFVSEEEVNISEDPDSFPALEFILTLEDGQILEYEAVGIFLLGEKEYMALHPKTDEDGVIHIMNLTQGDDDEIQLSPVEDEEEFEAAAETFYRLIADVDVDLDEGDAEYDRN